SLFQVKKNSLRWEHMCPRVLCQSYLDRSRPRIREPLLTFVLVLKPEGFMTASSLLDSRCDPLPSPILITDNWSLRRCPLSHISSTFRPYTVTTFIIFL